jgi:hypothetical protein
LGVTNLPSANIGNIQITGNTIATLNTDGDIVFDPNGSGNVRILANTSVTGNITASGFVSATGNVSGNYFIGNGSQLTGVTASSVDANALTGNTLSANVLYSSLTQVGTLSNVSVSGNVVGGNVITAGLISATADITSAANIVGGNVTTVGQVTATGNIQGGNVLTAGVISATSNVAGGNVLTGGVVSATANVTGGNVITGGIVSATGNISGNYFIGNGSQLTDVAASSVNANALIGNTLSSNVLYSSLTQVGTLSNVSVTGNVVGGNVLTGGVVSATGNVTSGGVIITGPSGNISGANVISATTFTATGNISGNYILGNGSQLTGIDATSIQNGNSNVRVAANSNVSVGISGTSNVAVFATDGQYISGLLSVTGNVTSGNVTTSSVSSTSSLGVSSGSNGNILLSADGSGIVKITGGTGFVVPVGNTAQRPVPVDNGTLRLNSTLNALEIYTLGYWQIVGPSTSNVTVTDQQIVPDGTSIVYTLNQVATSASIMVAINGVTQIPNDGYTVAGNLITFAEALPPSDYVDIRFLTSPVATPGLLFNTSGNSAIQVNDVPEIAFIVDNTVRTKITASGIVDISTGRSIKMPLYTVAQADNLTGRTEGEMIYVQNGDSGAACLAVFSGGVWKRVILGAAISG